MNTCIAERVVDYIYGGDRRQRSGRRGSPSSPPDPPPRSLKAAAAAEEEAMVLEEEDGDGLVGEEGDGEGEGGNFDEDEDEEADDSDPLSPWRGRCGSCCRSSPAARPPFFLRLPKGAEHPAAPVLRHPEAEQPQAHLLQQVGAQLREERLCAGRVRPYGPPGQRLERLLGQAPDAPGDLGDEPLPKVNHFPGSWCIGRKDRLARTLLGFKRRLGRVYDFHPEVYHLPSERRMR